MFNCTRDRQPILSLGIDCKKLDIQFCWFYRRRNDILDRFFFGMKVSSQIMTSSISSSFTDRILFLVSSHRLFVDSPQKTSEFISFILVNFNDLDLRVAYFAFLIEQDNRRLRFCIRFDVLAFGSSDSLMLHLENILGSRHLDFCGLIVGQL